MDLVERQGVVTMKGRPVVLQGPSVEVGRPAPGFRVVDGSFQPVELGAFAGRPLLISTVQSLDTGVCALQTKRFHEEVARLPADVVYIVLSTDLPFAQKRFCETEKVDRAHVLSDHVWRDFGLRYGVLIKDLGLLARAVFVIGRDGRLVYKQIVSELSEHPGYDEALEAIRAAAG
ncbi:MAG: thiol peroxidase [Candidatus Eisenbacteria bacterium]|uniref:Thiol peroxidase n=1 Tax=Eiseniibacteriota bacterium TaxID=2212470 RepID=A0A938BQP3_UNCEI|nr:thiol peroxidase [Candidatus Eisenbacteria bacterium]